MEEGRLFQLPFLAHFKIGNKPKNQKGDDGKMQTNALPPPVQLPTGIWPKFSLTHSFRRGTYIRKSNKNSWENQIKKTWRFVRRSHEWRADYKRSHSRSNRPTIRTKNENSYWNSEHLKRLDETNRYLLEPIPWEPAFFVLDLDVSLVWC